MDALCEKEYKSVYKKIDKYDYTIWKKNVQENIARNNEEGLENLKKEYEIKIYKAKICLDKENFLTFAYKYLGMVITLATVIVSLYTTFSSSLYGILRYRWGDIEDQDTKGKIYDILLNQMSDDWRKMVLTIFFFFLGIIFIYVIIYFNDKRCIEKHAFQVSYCEEILKIIEEEQKSKWRI